MPCGQKTELWNEAEKVKKKWINSPVLEKWGFTDDVSAFKRLFETATDKPFLEGEQLNPMDFKKMNVAIDNLETDLKSPGILSNKVLRSFYTGSAKTMRNPITRDFYNTLVNANEFRNRHSQQMMTSYNLSLIHI